MSDIALIAAMAENRVIGGDNQLLWHLPEDMKHFRTLTTGKPIIMGRKTYDSIGRPLPNRRNIVVTRNTGWRADGVDVATSLESALQTASQENAKEVMVIGGAMIYKAALPSATTVYLTHIHKVYTGDASFPVLPPEEWKVTDRMSGTQCAKAGMDYEFLTYKRI